MDVCIFNHKTSNVHKTTTLGKVKVIV